MKKLLKVLALVLVLVLAISVMVACNDDGKKGGSSDGKGDSSSTDGKDSGKKDDKKDDKDDKDDEDEDEDEGGSGSSSSNSKFTVTFKFIDKNGSPLADVDGYFETAQRNVKSGTNARDNLSGEVDVFENYVIIGWNRNEADAKAGKVDANATKNITADTTLYSVIRAKEEKTVKFYSIDGKTLLGEKKYLEGDALGKETPRPTEAGQYFKKWDFLSNDEADKTDSNESIIYGNCSFKAVMGATDGTIGKTTSTIVLDGRKDDAYTKSNTYLALNNKKTANDSKTVADEGSYADPEGVNADTWMVWDGAYVYLLIEVYDTTLTYRSEAYAKAGPDAWCNDAVELWYNFEQETAETKNSTRIGLAASGDRQIDGDGKYALPRSEYNGAVTGIFGGRSTHFEEIKYAVRNYLIEKEKGTAGDITGLDKNGVTAPSYVIEFKIPAKPEAEADLNYAYKDWDGAKEQKLTGVELENFKATGRLYGKAASENDISAYRFTEVENLQVGDFVRFSLQINDLKIGVGKLAQDYFDSVTLAELQVADKSYTQTQYDACKIKLWELKDGVVKTASTHDLFTAAGSTQYDLTKYLMFSLGGEEEGAYFVHGFAASKTDYKAVVMLDKDGNTYTRKQDVTAE